MSITSLSPTLGMCSFTSTLPSLLLPSTATPLGVHYWLLRISLEVPIQNFGADWMAFRAFSSPAQLCSANIRCPVLATRGILARQVFSVSSAAPDAMTPVSCIVWAECLTPSPCDSVAWVVCGISTDRTATISIDTPTTTPLVVILFIVLTSSFLVSVSLDLKSTGANPR